MAYAATDCITKFVPMPIDTVWAGTTVSFDAIENDAFVYIAYYDAERWLSVAQVDKCTGGVQKVTLPSQFEGWDAHNYLTLAFDQTGNLHVAGNMHGNPMTYARTNQPDQLQQLATLRSMSGDLEQRVTYPKFFKFNDGELGFMYRDGGSGNGQEIINRLENNAWQRWLDQPLFAPSSQIQPVNAYHTGFIKGDDCFFHIAWVWRSNPNVETNFNVNYAKSPDLKHWFNSAGEALTLPITPESNVMVDLIAPESGLFNNIQLGFDTNNQPVISYLKFDDNGYSQLHHARLQNNEWQIIASTNWSYRWNPTGRGTIPAEISFSGIQKTQNRITEYVQHSQLGTMMLDYDVSSLQAEGIIQMPQPVSTDKAGLSLNRKHISNSQHELEIQWFTMPADNQDQPRNCDLNKCIFSAPLNINSHPNF